MGVCNAKDQGGRGCRGLVVLRYNDAVRCRNLVSMALSAAIAHTLAANGHLNCHRRSPPHPSLSVHYSCTPPFRNKAVFQIVIDKTDRVGHGSRGWELMSPPDPARDIQKLQLPPEALHPFV
jgi:hypothetical protein